MLELLQQGFGAVFSLHIMLLMVIGVAVGIVFGAVPGLSATMAVALCLPLTFTMGPQAGLSLLVALFIGATSGGLISAILLKIPGTPSSIATVFDGGPLMEQGPRRRHRVFLSRHHFQHRGANVYRPAAGQGRPAFRSP
jgi:putative tricarboxylic transport membrane protein